MLLQHYNLNPEKLRQLFFRHQKGSKDSWRSYTHVLNIWINELKLENFSHIFVDLVQWNKLIDPIDVAETIDEYENLIDELKRNLIHTKPWDVSRFQLEDKYKYKFNEKLENTKNNQFVSASEYREKDK